MQDFDSIINSTATPTGKRPIAHRAKATKKTKPERKRLSFRKRTGVTHDFTETYWGHSVEVTSIRGKKIRGHGWGAGGDVPLTGFSLIPLGGEIPRLGDWLLLRDGQRYLITKIEGVRDPDDMFFFEARLDRGKN